MNTTEQIKQYILHDCKMDAVGIAPVSAFDYENGLHTPEHILPNAKSVIVFTKRIPDGVIQAAFRRLEDHNADAHSIYAAFGSDLTPNMTLFLMQFNIAQYIERNFGFVTVPRGAGLEQPSADSGKRTSSGHRTCDHDIGAGLRSALSGRKTL